MTSDSNSRPLPPLKRFARLEMDGDPPPPPRPKTASGRPAPASQAGPPTVPASRQVRDGDDVIAARQVAADLTANARQSLAQTTPQARRADRAQQLRERMASPATAAPIPAGQASGGATRTLRFDFQPTAARTPGVVVMEIDLTEERSAARRADVMRPGVRWDGAPRARAEARPGPIELTPLAARQVMLMAWEAGLPGSGLRILTSFTPGLGGPELDFAFDDDVQDDDHVFLSNGVRIIVDPESLRHVRGRRITWHDVPGSEGFSVR